MFSNKNLRRLIIPLFIEQFLLMFVGIADTFVVSFSCEADVSGVSLVTSFNTVLIFLFTALSSGGAVIISQYISNKKEKTASRSAGQLLMISAVISVVMTSLILIFHTQLLQLLFGKIEADVMAACESYLRITTLSLPFLAIYDAGAALCRCIKKNQCDNEHFHCCQCDQCRRKLCGGIRIENGSGRCCTAVVFLACPFRRCGYCLLLQKTVRGEVLYCRCVCVGRQPAEKSHGNRTAERCGKRCSPARKSGAFKYGCTVRNLSDRSRQTLFICFLPYGLFQPETLLAEFADAELDAPLDILRCRFKVQ